MVDSPGCFVWHLRTMAKIEALSYALENKNFIGHLAYDGEKRPTVLVVPTWMGLNAFTRDKTEALVELGYTAYGVDLFGEGLEAQTPEEARKLIAPLFSERQLIVERLSKAIEAVSAHPSADPNKVAMIGFCFGGLCVLEFTKTGYPLKGAVTFHAALGNPYDLHVQPIEIASSIPASILMLQGYKDALAPEGELRKLEKELTQAGADWQMVIYGNAMHAFTNPKANMPEHSLQYHELTAERAWLAMKNFLSEIFSRPV